MAYLATFFALSAMPSVADNRELAARAKDHLPSSRTHRDVADGPKITPIIQILCNQSLTRQHAKYSIYVFAVGGGWWGGKPADDIHQPAMTSATKRCQTSAKLVSVSELEEGRCMDVK